MAEATITVDLDGLRTNLANSVKELKAFVEHDINDYDECDLFDIINDVIRWSNAINMVFSDEMEGFSNLTDKNFIEFFDN